MARKPVPSSDATANPTGWVVQPRAGAGDSDAIEQVHSMLNDVCGRPPDEPIQADFLIGMDPLERRRKRVAVAHDRRRADKLG